MKRLVLLILVLALAIAIGVNLRAHPGMVVLWVAPWRIDMPLSIAILLFVLAYLAVHYVLWLLSGILHFPIYLRNMSRALSQRRARRLTHRGFIALNEGDFISAEKSLIASAKQSEFPWLNYIYAAQCAQQLGKTKKQSEYLRQAYEILPSSAVAIDLVKAQLQYQDGQYEQSLATLMHLQYKAPRNSARLKLLQALYLKLRLFEPLAELLTALKHQNVLSKSAYQELEKTVWYELLLSKSTATFEECYALWQKIPKQYRTNSDLALIYAKVLNRHHKPIEAQIVLRNALEKYWREDLIRLYGQISHPFPERILKVAENWLHAHSQSPNLLLSLGRLCAKEGLFGKAQRYFEASLALMPSVEAYAELGALLEKMNQLDQSRAYYKKGVLLSCPIGLTEIASVNAVDDVKA